MTGASSIRPDAMVVAELAPAGRLRMAIYYGNPVLAQRDTRTGQPRGVSADLARELAARVALELELITFDAAGRGAAYDLFLTRTQKNAQLVRADTPARALDLFVARQLEAATGVRQPLNAFAKLHPGQHVIDESFATIRQAMAVPRGRVPPLATLKRSLKR